MNLQLDCKHFFLDKDASESVGGGNPLAVGGEA
jgi:hypothetical protein